MLDLHRGLDWLLGGGGGGGRCSAEPVKKSPWQMYRARFNGLVS